MRKAVKVGNVTIGGGAPISVQSMTNTNTENLEATEAQIIALAEAGADLVRVSVPSEKAVFALRELVRESPVPLIADVHYNEKIAMLAMDAGVAKLRVNPANLSQTGLKKVAARAKEGGIPIRVGVNAGGFDESLGAEALCEKALEAARLFEQCGNEDLVLAVKSSDVRKTVQTYRLLAKRCDYPLHIGLTEAGTPRMGSIRSAIAVGALLLDGIGDTVRISLAGDPIPEVKLAIDLLSALGLRTRPHIIACPTCARTQIDVAGLAQEVEEALYDCKLPLKIAVMGCSVNGIGEGKDADFGICGGASRSAVFEKGQIIKEIPNTEIISELKKLADKYHG